MEVMTNLDSVLKSKDIISPKRVHVFKDTAFPVIMYGCESWTIKKAECWSIDAFELWCCRSLLRVPRTAKWSNQWILKEINPEYSLERLRTDAEAPILWPSDAKTWLVGKNPDAGWWQKEKWAAEDEMIRWHHRPNEQTLGNGGGREA